MAFFDEHIETMPQERIREIQLQKFKKQVRHIFENNAFMRKRLLETGAVLEEIKNWEDIKKVPFTHKKDLRENYPLGLLSGNWEDVVRIHMTSGTTGVSTPMVYSRNDLEVWTECMARNFVAGGIKKGDIVQQAHGLGLFTGVLAFITGWNGLGLK